MAEAHARCEVVIQRPLPEVYAYVVDYRNNPAWQDGTERAEQADHPPVVGSRITTHQRLMGRVSTSTVRVTELIPEQRIRSVTESGPVDYQGGYDFEATPDGGTRITYQGLITTGRLMGPVGKLLAKGFQHKMEGSLAQLKGLLESRTS